MKSGIFGKEYSKILTEAFQVRSESDYDDYYIISKDEADAQILKCTNFLSGYRGVYKRYTYSRE